MATHVINSYPKIYNIGHKYILDLFNEEVSVQEKIDGSQISFGVIDGELCARSKGKDLVLDAPEKMFNKAIEDGYVKLSEKVAEQYEEEYPEEDDDE